MEKLKHRFRQAVMAGLLIAIAIVALALFITHRAALADRCDVYADQPVTDVPADCREYLLK